MRLGGTHERMVQEAGDVSVVEHRTAAPFLPLLQSDEPLDKGVRGGLAEGIPHGDVHLFHLRRNGMEHRQEQVFVRKNNGGILIRNLAGRTPFFEKFGHVAALHGIGRRAHGPDLFGPGEVGGTAPLSPVAVPTEVLPDEHSALLHLAAGIVHVVIPVKLRAAPAPEEIEKRFLRLAQRVEPDENIPFAQKLPHPPGLRMPGRFEGARFVPQDVRRLAVDHAGIGHAAFLQPFPVSRINVV